MAQCKRCEGWGLERDPQSSDGWARDGGGAGIVCRKDKGGCGESGLGKADQGSLEPAAAPANAPGFPEARG